MVQINFAQKSVTVKVVYYGPGMSGKTTNLEVVHQRAPETSRGDLTSISTDGDRTLFFDFMPLDLGTVAGMRTQFQIYTVPGQVYYNSTRKLVLQGVDGVVFVADSSASMIEENLESLRNLEENLAEYGKSLQDIPIILQYNKRDLPDALPVEDLDRVLNTMSAPTFEAVANTGQGVFPTLKALAARVLDTIHKQSADGKGAAKPAPRPAPAGQQALPNRGVPAGSIVAPRQQVQPQPVEMAPPVAPPPMAAPEMAAPMAHAAPPVQAGATGFYRAPNAPPVQQGGTGFYPAPGAPQQQPQHQPQQHVHMEPPSLASAPPVAPPQFPQHEPAMPTAFQHGPQTGYPQGQPMQQTGFHAPPTQQTGFHPHPGQNLRMAPGDVSGSQASGMPGQSLGKTDSHPMFQPSVAPPRPMPQAAAAPQVPPPRIKPRGGAMATPNPSERKSTMTTVVFMVVALGVGVAIGGLAFGLF